MKKNKLEIKEKFKRSALAEGRNYGVGFAILKKISRYSYETLLPYSACKDYLNDLSFKNFYNKRVSFKIHGYTATKMECYNNSHKYFYLGVKMLKYNSGAAWTRSAKATTLMLSNSSNLINILNKLEDKLDLDTRRITLFEYDDKNIILKVPAFWMKKTYLISMLTLAIRIYFNTTKEDTEKDFLTFVKDHVPFMQVDAYNSANILKFLNLELSGKAVMVNYPDKDLTADNSSTIHNAGICGFVKYVNNNIETQ